MSARDAAGTGEGGRATLPSVHTYVLLRAPGGVVAELYPGDFVGRAASAALALDDGRVSEAHAMVSLREGQLHLLPLRGTLALDGEPVSHVILRPGLTLELAPGVALAVLEVHLPDAVLGVEGEGLLRQMVPSVASILSEGRLRVVSGFREDAAAQLWSSGDGFRARVGDHTIPVAAGDELVLGGRRVRFVAIPLGEAGPDVTRRDGGLSDPIHVVARFDTVQLHREGRAPVHFAGMQARLLTELLAVGGPIGWSALTQELWPDEDDAVLRRGRLDALLLRVRRRLRAAGLRADLVRTDGSGTVELVRYPHDRFEDRS